MPRLTIKTLLIFIVFFLCLADNSYSEESKVKIILVQAVMCEAIENFKPVNPSVVFSISQGEVFCFSNFDPVLEKTIIYHKWYNKDRLISTMQLTLIPPKWSSFSRIQIRNEDKGPWRVEIRNTDDILLQTLRFSMVD